MKKVLLTLTVVLTTLSTFAQTSLDDIPMYNISGGSGFEIEANFLSVAASDGIDTASGSGIQISPSYDFFSGSFKFAPEVDLNLVTADGIVAFGVLPGLKIGHDNIYGVVSYNIGADVPYFGIGGSIPVGDNAINISAQGGRIADIGIGYVSVGYAFKF